jgi:hypothetical protein
MEINAKLMDGLKTGITVKQLCNNLKIKYRTQVIPFCESRDREGFKPLTAKDFWLSKLSIAGTLFYMQELLDEIQGEYQQDEIWGSKDGSTGIISDGDNTCRNRSVNDKELSEQVN